MSSPVPTGDEKPAVSVEVASPGSGTGNEDTALVAGAALSESAHATETAETATEVAETAQATAEVGTEIAVTADTTANDALGLARQNNERLDDVGRALVMIGGAVDAHTQALTELLRDRQAGQTVPSPGHDSPSAGAVQEDSEPRPKHFLERRVGGRKR